MVALFPTISFCSTTYCTILSNSVYFNSKHKNDIQLWAWSMIRIYNWAVCVCIGLLPFHLVVTFTVLQFYFTICNILFSVHVSLSLCVCSCFSVNLCDRAYRLIRSFPMEYVDKTFYIVSLKWCVPQSNLTTPYCTALHTPHDIQCIAQWMHYIECDTQ